LLAIVFVLWIRIALRDAYTTTSPALGARRVATQKGLSTWTAMLAVPGKSSGKCGGTTILCYAACFSKRPQLVIGRFGCVNPVKARGSGAMSLALEQLSSEVADDAPIAHCRASLKARRLGVTAGA
jgi:hypothetical protein